MKIEDDLYYLEDNEGVVTLNVIPKGNHWEFVVTDFHSATSRETSQTIALDKETLLDGLLHLVENIKKSKEADICLVYKE